MRAQFKAHMNLDSENWTSASSYAAPAALVELECVCTLSDQFKLPQRHAVTPSLVQPRAMKPSRRKLNNENRNESSGSKSSFCLVTVVLERFVTQANQKGVTPRAVLKGAAKAASLVIQDVQASLKSSA